jgi:scyllo-inositol 2-dehydrogenase (NADP+)
MLKRERRRSMGDRIGVGVASFGMSGRVFHLPLLLHHGAFRVIGVVERTKSELRRQHPALKVYRSFDDMLADDEIELAVVNTPDQTHYDLAMRALRAGRHVVVEKPFVQTVEQGGEVISLARRAGKRLCVFHNRRWDGDFLTVRRILREGQLGRIVEYEAHWDRYRNAVQSGTWKEERVTGAELLYNLGSHMIDQALVLFGMPREVTAHLHSVRPSGRVNDWFDVRLHYPDLLVSLKASYLVREPGPRYLIHGESGSFVKYGIDPQEQALIGGTAPTSPDWGAEGGEWWGVLHTELGGTVVRQKVETERGRYQSFYDSVRDAIMSGRECAVTPEEALNVIRVITAAMRSNDERRTMPVL